MSMNKSAVVRRDIMRVLHVAHPDWMRDEDLLESLADVGTVVDAQMLSSDLFCLRDFLGSGNGYVELQELEARGGVKIPQSRLTPLGVDVVEKNADAPDPKRIASF